MFFFLFFVGVFFFFFSKLRFESFSLPPSGAFVIHLNMTSEQNEFALKVAVKSELKLDPSPWSAFDL